MDNTKNVKINTIKQIYNHLGDEISRSIFGNRLLYTFTNDLEYLRKVIYTTDEGLEIKKLIDANKKIVLFGAGAWGKAIAHVFGEFVQCFIDNFPSKQKSELCMNIPVISFSEYIKRQKRQDKIVITTRLYQEEVYRQLLASGIKEENIINAGMMLTNLMEKQYFDLPVFQNHKIEEGETFVDGGSLNGNTSINFIKWCDGKYDKIWIFEPDESSRAVCENTLYNNGCNKFEIIPKALWSKEAILDFNLRPGGASAVIYSTQQYNNGGCVGMGGGVSVEAVNLDAVINEKVTFIKMDIEGAEYNALMGSKRTITRYKPKLAISVYHKLEDILVIPELICQINPDYTLYLRHYSLANGETVLYAI